MADSKREGAINGLKAAADNIVGATVKKNAAVTQSVPAGGLMIVRDGDQGEPVAVYIGNPTQYAFEHRATVEVLVKDGNPATRDATMDTLLQGLETQIAADRTLGGAVDWAEALPPQFIEEIADGAPTIKGAEVGVMLHYVTTSPLS